MTFTKGSVSDVTPANGTLEVKFKDLILNDDAVAKADLVVLATGQVPNSGVDIDQVPADDPNIICTDLRPPGNGEDF